MIEADLINLAICEKHAEVGDGMQSSIIQVHALGLRHKDGAAEAWAKLVLRRGKHTLSACRVLSFICTVSSTEAVQAHVCTQLTITCGWINVGTALSRSLPNDSYR